MQGAQYRQVGGVGLVDRFKVFLGKLHAGVGLVDAHDGMAQLHKGPGHAQAEFPQADHADFQ